MAWLMFWHGQYFVAVNGLTLLMFWHSRCFGTFDIIEPLMFRCSQCFGAVSVQVWLIFEVPQGLSLAGICATAPKHQGFYDIERAKTLTVPKH